MDIKDTLHTAQQLMSQNLLEKADKLYCSILEQYPKNFDAHLQRGRILRLQAKREDALNYFKKTFEMYPGQAPIIFELAKALLHQGYFKAAEVYYERLMEKIPGYFWALMGLGNCARRQAQHELALDYFQQAASSKPEMIDASVEVAVELRMLNQIAESDALYHTLLKREPENLKILKGLELNALKIANKEETELKQQVVQYPDKLQKQLDIAAEFQKLSWFGDAEAIYHNILIKSPDDFEALYGLAVNTRNQGGRRSALSQFQYLLQIYPEDPRSILGVITELRSLGQLNEALDYLQVAEQKFPENFLVPLQQGHVYQQLGDREQALSYFQKATTLEPLNQQTKLHIATEYFALGKVSSAIANVQQVLQQNPRQFRALLQLGNWLMLARAFEEAQHYFQQALEANPRQIQPYLQSAQAFLELGEIVKCFALLEKATSVLGKKPELYHKKIQILWATRQIELALTIQTEAIHLFPDHYPLQLQQIDFQVQRGQYKEALDNITLLATNSISQQLRVSLLKARILKEQWRLTEALQQYQTILKDNSHCLEARQAILLISLINMDIKSAREQAYILGKNNLGGQKIKGQNRSYLHNHHAQLMDEYQINQPVLQRLQTAITHPVVQRLQTITEIVLEEPEATSGAVTLLAQLRQAGYFEAMKSKRELFIPKKIFQYWDEPNPPEEVLSFTQSWQQHHPDYDYQLFDEQKACEFLQQYYPQKVLICYLRCKHVAQRADVLRLAILSHYGGIYADADDYCLQPLDELLFGGEQLILWQENMATVGNNFIAVTARHPVITQALESAINAVERRDNDSIWLSTGPGLISRSLAYYLAMQWPKQTPQDLGITVLTQAELMNFVGIHGKLAYKSTQSSWLIKEFSQGNRIELKGLIPTKANNA